MKFTAATAAIAAANVFPIVSAKKNIGGKSLARDGKTSDDTYLKARGYHKHWTMPLPSEDGDNKRFSPASNSGLLTNQRTLKETEDLAMNIVESSSKSSNWKKYRNNDQDLGILSSPEQLVRHLRPLDKDQDGKPDSVFFDSLNALDPDGKAFYPICDSSGTYDEYFCGRCDTNSGRGTVADFECQRIACYEINSRCPNNRMVVCRYDDIERLFETEPNGDYTGTSFTTEKCRKIETRLSKTNRNFLPDEETSWEFGYCLRYTIGSVPTGDEGETPSPNTCEMEIDGIICDSCQLDFVDVVTTNEDGSSTTTKQFCANFDCGNTLLGYSGRFCNDRIDLATTSIDYFLYRSLPCDGGCNLCGESDPGFMQMMKFRDASFTVGTDVSYNCFEAQFAALSGPTGGEFCQAVQTTVQEACGCSPLGVAPPTQVPLGLDSDGSGDDNGDEESSDEESSAATVSLGAVKKFLLTVAAASIMGFSLV